MTPPAEQLWNILAQLLQAAGHARNYVDGLSKESFMADPKTQDAVILKILVIGELSARILDTHPDFVRQHSHIPWAPMKGMRNRIAHGYFEINLDTVWSTVHHDIPALEKNLLSVMPVFPQGPRAS